MGEKNAGANREGEGEGKEPSSPALAARTGDEARRMSSLARFFVEKHWKIAQVVGASSVLFGFVYTMKHGTSPFQDSSDAVRRGARDLPLHSVSMKLNLGQGRAWPSPRDDGNDK